MTTPTISWRRLDLDGREVCTITETSEGCRITGMTELREADGSSCLAYCIRCDQAWETETCEVAGLVRNEPVAVSIRRTRSGAWTIDGIAAPQVAECADIDLAFSPVTNLLPIRRLRLAIGDTARVSAAWLRFPELALERLDQTYTRLARTRYLYESADGAFRRELTVDDQGFVVDYPGLWTRLSNGDAGSP